MKKLAVLFHLFLFLLSAKAQSVDLKGVVKDRYTGDPVPGAKVTLVGKDWSAATDRNGIFQISSPTWLRRFFQPALQTNPVFQPGKGLIFRNPDNGWVTLQIADLTGKRAVRIIKYPLGRGIWQVSPGELGPGIYVGTLTTSRRTERFRFALVDRETGAGEGPTLLVPEREFLAAAKAAAIVDTLRTTKAGYFTDTLALSTWGQSDIEILLSDTSSSNAYLSALALSSGILIPAFDHGTFVYTATVGNEVSALTVTPTLQYAKATIKVNNQHAVSGTPTPPIPLAPGSNTIGIEVTAQNGGTRQTYTLAVTRAKSSDASLNELSVSAGSLIPAFAPTDTAFVDTVPTEVGEITLTARAAHGATLQINGVQAHSGVASQPINLVTGGNSISVEVLAEDSIARKTYRIGIFRRPSQDAGLAELVLSEGILSPVFHTETTAYADSVPYATTSLRIVPTASSLGASIRVNGKPVASGTSSDLIYLTVGGNAVAVEVTAQDGETRRTYSVSVLRAANNDATLSNLSLSQGNLSPAFNAMTTNYTAAVPNSVTSITIAPTTDDPSATVKIRGILVPSGVASGPFSLEIGDNSFPIEVRAQDGRTTTSYTIAIRRLPSENADLSDLVLDCGTLNPVFSSATTIYAVSVGNAVGACSITPTASQAMATIRVNGTPISSGQASVPIPLVEGGSVTMSVQVTAEDGVTSKTYSIAVNRSASGNAELSDLELSCGSLSPAFSPATENYSASVGNAVGTCAVKPTAAHGLATIRVNGTIVPSGSNSPDVSLQVGSTVISIVVTAQDGQKTKSYSITVGKAPSANADLSNLEVSAGQLTPAFSSSTTSYVDSVSNGTASISVTPTAAHGAAIIEVDGTIVPSGNPSADIALAEGTNTTVVIRVTAEDRTATKIYALVVNRAFSSNADLANLSLACGALNQPFSPNTTSFSTSVANAVTGCTVTPTAASQGASIKVNGTAVPSGNASAVIPLAVGNTVLSTKVTAQDGRTEKTYTVTVTRAPNANAELSALEVSAGQLSPSFSPSVNGYVDSVTNGTSSITISPTVAHAAATIRVNGTIVVSGSASAPIPLVEGGNTTVNIQVMAEDGTTTKTYSLVVHRGASANADLANMVSGCGALNPAFSSATISYTDSVDNAVGACSVTPTAAHAAATILVNGVVVSSGSASMPIPLVVGNTVLSIKVTAQDGQTSKTYTVTINRAPSHNAALSSLAVSAGQLRPAFSSQITAYTDTVPNEIGSLTITPTAAQAGAVVRVNGTVVVSGGVSAAIPLVEAGNTTVSISVTAEDGTTAKTYTLLVRRLASTNASLSNLSLGCGPMTPAFSPGITAYSASVANVVAGCTVTPTASAQGAAIQVNGTSVASGGTTAMIPLVVGNNALTVVVTAPNGSTTRTYVVTVNRARSSDASLSNLALSCGSLVPSFSSGTTSYSASVANTVTSCAVTPTVSYAAAMVRVNGTPVPSGSTSSPIALSVGPNTITVAVTAEDGITIRAYGVVVDRARSSDANLADLTLTCGQLIPSFSSGTTAYSATVANTVTSCAVTPTVSFPAAVIRVNGVAVTSGSASPSLALAIGPNAFNIVVTAEDGTQKTYTAVVNRANPSYDGSWSGRTSQDSTFTFTVQNNGVPTLHFGFVFPGTYCTAQVSTTLTFGTPLAISGNSFAYSWSSYDNGYPIRYAISGTFTSGTTASGTLSVSGGYCQGTTNATWTANKAAGMNLLSLVPENFANAAGETQKQTFQDPKYGTVTLMTMGTHSGAGRAP